ncbi:hypothetical protein [Azovibrio sp.]|uniref:hypothetical protein n=1 Tax=Azovibrio sp. TaxID=1872673 RepID=UPI003C777743
MAQAVQQIHAIQFGDIRGGDDGHHIMVEHQSLPGRLTIRRLDDMKIRIEMPGQDAPDHFRTMNKQDISHGPALSWKTGSYAI